MTEADTTIPRDGKPDWAKSRRERENDRRAREGLPPRRRRWPWVVLVLLLAGGGAGWAFRDRLMPPAPPQAETPAPAAPVEEIDSRLQINPFEYARIAPQRLQRTLRVTGTIRPSHQAELASQTTGRVETVTARPGDRVSAGQLLVQVDVERLTLDLNLQRSNAEATRVQLQLAETQLERVRALVERGVATASDLDQAESNVEGLRATLSAQTDQVAGAELSLRNATITAPLDGIVSSRSVEPGQFVSVGAPLMTVVDLSTVELEAFAPVAAGVQIAAGQVVSVVVDGIPGRTFTGTVERINPVAAAGSRSIPVYVQMENPGGVLLGGMFATGEITIAEVADAIAIPTEALREDREGPHVLRIADGVLERRAVTPGEEWRGDLTQIVDGISPGDVVVTAALPELSPGDAVVLVEE